MTLGNLIDLLESFGDKQAVCPVGLGYVDSWRGIYAELAFDIKENASIQEMLDLAKSADGNVFMGYKGGRFKMSKDTEIHLDSYGDFTDGGYAAIIIRMIDPNIDTEGRMREWLTEKAIRLMLQYAA